MNFCEGDRASPETDPHPGTAGEPLHESQSYSEDLKYCVTSVAIAIHMANEACPKKRFHKILDSGMAANPAASRGEGVGVWAKIWPSDGTCRPTSRPTNIETTKTWSVSAQIPGRSLPYVAKVLGFWRHRECHAPRGKVYTRGASGTHRLSPQSS